jgi:uncharacterized protein
MSGKRARQKRREEERGREAKLEALYARIPDMECKGLCASVACEHIPMSQTERARLEAAVGRDVTIPEDAPLICPALEAGRCSVYDSRPLMCRLWGAAEGLACPHGCRPADPVSRQDAIALMREKWAFDGPSDVNLAWNDPRRAELQAEAQKAARSYLGRDGS